MNFRSKFATYTGREQYQLSFLIKAYIFPVTLNLKIFTVNHKQSSIGYSIYFNTVMRCNNNHKVTLLLADSHVHGQNGRRPSDHLYIKYKVIDNKCTIACRDWPIFFIPAQSYENDWSFLRRKSQRRLRRLRWNYKVTIQVVLIRVVQ